MTSPRSDVRPLAVQGADGPPIDILGSFESTYLPAHDRDIAETTQHDLRWRDDFGLLRDAGIARLRYPVRWHRVEETEGVFDWTETDAQLGYLHDEGFRPIVDLVHHTSYPGWLTDGFADERFAAAYLRYAEAFARRYPWVDEYTLFNEPFSTLFLSGHEAIWPPYHSGLRSFIDLVANVMPAVAAASRLYQELLPLARHVWVDTCEFHTGSDASGQAYADFANERRFLVLDAFLGLPFDEHGLVAGPLAEAGGERLLGWEPGSIDVLGLDYYAHCQWDFAVTGGTAPTTRPMPFAEQVEQYWQRYRIPCMLTETNIRGTVSDRVTWLKYMLEQCETAQGRGVPIEGFCWFPFIDSTDWNSLLARCEGRIDPVGVYWLDAGFDRHGSVMSSAYETIARGGSASDLPAYRLAEPVATWIAGYADQMSHWTWQDPPADEVGSNPPLVTTRMELRVVDAD